jgi:hypothetical protein
VVVLLGCPMIPISPDPAGIRGHTSRDRPSGIHHVLGNWRTQPGGTRAEGRSWLGQGLRPAANQIREPRQGDEKTDVSTVIDCDRFFCCSIRSLHDL